MTRPWVLVAFHLSSPMSRLASEKAEMAGEEKKGNKRNYDISRVYIQCPHLKVLYVQFLKRHFGQIAPHFILLRIAMLFLFKTHMCDCLNPYHSVARNT